MTDEVVNPIPFPNAHVHDMTLPRPRVKEINELIVSQDLDLGRFSWGDEVSSKFQRPDVRVSRLTHSSGGYFLFNSTREGSMFFTRSPGLNTKEERGNTSDWPHQLTAVREWLTALKAEVEETADLQLGLEDSISKSEIDDLLGLYRRGVFDRDVREFTARAEEAVNPLALIMIDIDKFKLVNDTYGHRAGDQVLQLVANMIKRSAGSKGRSYRYGGEELAVILPNYSGEEAAALAERIRTEIEGGSIGGKGIKVTASFGVAQLPVHATTPEALVEAADAALYDAKNRGRNLVRVSGDPEPQAAPRVRRRQPPLTALSDEEATAIQRHYFRYHNARCPRDESLLRIEEYESDETVTPDLRVACPYCGLSERIRSS